MTDEDRKALFERLDKIDVNIRMLVEGFQLVCQELGIRERIAQIRDTLPPVEEATQHGE